MGHTDTAAPVILDESGTDGARAPSARWVLVGLAMSTLLAALGTSVANVGLPTLADAFDVSFRAVQWVVLAYLLAITTLIVGAGRLGDIVGRRRLLLVGLALFTAASLACATTSVLPMLLAARAVQGAGAAIMMALALAMVGDTVPASRSATAIGLLGTMSAVGTALGPSLGGLLLEAFGWRALFLLLVPLGLATLVIAHRHLPPDHRVDAADADTFDGRGTVLLALALGAYALAMTWPRGRPGANGLWWLLAAGAGAVFFARSQSRAPSPLIRLAALRDRALMARLVANALVATVMMATLVVGPFYLAQGLGLEPARVGLTMTAGPLVAALAGVPAGRVTDRLGTRASSLAGLSTMVSGTILLALPPLLAGAPGYAVPMVLLTAGYALFQTANNAAVMTGAGTRERGAIAGLLNLSRNLGLVTGASVMGATFALGVDMAGAGAPGAIAATFGLRITFAAASILVVGALVASARARARRIGAAATLALLATAMTATSGYGQTAAARRAEPAARALLSPYPMIAAGWGPTVGSDRYMSRWAEDWSAKRATGSAPALKAVPLPRGGSFTLSGETRVRHDGFVHAQLRRDDVYAQTLLRGTVGADVRLNRHLRVYTEIGTGQTDRLRHAASANFQNDAPGSRWSTGRREGITGRNPSGPVGRARIREPPTAVAVMASVDCFECRRHTPRPST